MYTNTVDNIELGYMHGGKTSKIKFPCLLLSRQYNKGRRKGIEHPRPIFD